MKKSKLETPLFAIVAEFVELWLNSIFQQLVNSRQ